MAVRHHIFRPITYSAVYASQFLIKPWFFSAPHESIFTAIFLLAVLAYQLPSEWPIILCLLHSRVFLAQSVEFFLIPATNQS